MRILGIDPGLARLGYGVIEKIPRRGNDSLTCVSFGTIFTSKDEVIGERLQHIHRELKNLLKLYKPDAVSLETLFFFRNQTTIIQIGQVLGVLALTLHQAKLPIYRYAPLQIKNVLTGNGKAEKKHVEREVKKLLRMKDKIDVDDTADGLAVALCYFLAPEGKTIPNAKKKSKKKIVQKKS